MGLVVQLKYFRGFHLPFVSHLAKCHSGFVEPYTVAAGGQNAPRGRRGLGNREQQRDRLNNGALNCILVTCWHTNGMVCVFRSIRVHSVSTTIYGTTEL